MTQEHRYDIYGVGNALVDMEVQVDDAALAACGLRKGVMTLVSTQEQTALLAALGNPPFASAAGGSAANTTVGVARFGGTAFFCGKVGDDMSGALYRRSMAEAGVEFDVEAADGPTGSCLVLVTPDGERTMRTSLGSSHTLGPSDTHADRIARSRLLYVEGYLWGAPSTAAAGHAAVEAARSAGVPVAFSFSDPTMVEQYGDAFRELVRAGVDIIFCNEEEAKLYSGTRDRRVALADLGRNCSQVFMTCGADGSLIHDRGRVVPVPGYRVQVVDTTGAGDVYAAGVIYGLTHSMSPDQAGMLGSYASARIVAEMGPRLKAPLANRISAILDGAHPLD